ncbi:hypothetical protein Tco_0026689 [Tanacetum coccineum]
MLILSESDKSSSDKMKTITMDIDLEAPTVPEAEEKETVNEQDQVGSTSEVAVCSDHNDEGRLLLLVEAAGNARSVSNELDEHIELTLQLEVTIQLLSRSRLTFVIDDEDVSASGFENKEEILSYTEFINFGSKEKVKDSTVLDVTNGFSLSSKDNWKLIGQYENPDEEDIEGGATQINMKEYGTVAFMLKDSIDLRKNKWQQRRKVEGQMAAYRGLPQQLRGFGN